MDVIPSSQGSSLSMHGTTQPEQEQVPIEGQYLQNGDWDRHNNDHQLFHTVCHFFDPKWHLYGFNLVFGSHMITSLERTNQWM
jgi:hypothetical protein